MTDYSLMTVALLLPFVCAALLPLLHRFPNRREGVTLVTATALFAVVVQMLSVTLAGEELRSFSFSVIQGLQVGFKAEALGLLFACLASGLWIVNSVYSIGYMRSANEPRQTSFYVCFAVAIGAVMIVAFSSNLFTLFLGYELLTISTYPLVTHKKSEQAKRAGRLYLILLLSTSMVFLLPAIIWTSFVAGTLEFTPGGILAGKISSLSVGVLLALFVFGIGKAALMPVHFWLPAAMVAPTPVSALLHAVAVVKAGVFSILKIAIYIFGIDLLASTDTTEWLVYLAATSLLIGSLIAMTKDNLKARLAYSTISQLAYVVLAVGLANDLAVVGAGMHIVTHAFAKITLFFCAGAIYVMTGKTEIRELDGLGKAMPFTFSAFFIGALSIIGMPPLGGMWSKWYMVFGALQADQIFILAVLVLSSLFNVIYLLPIPFRAFFLPSPGVKDGSALRIREAPWPCLLAMAVTVSGCILLFFFPELVLDQISLIGLRRG